MNTSSKVGAGPGVHPDNRKSKSKTALHEAASEGHVGAIQLLLSAGALRDSHKSNGWTPLMFSCVKGLSTQYAWPPTAWHIVSRGPVPSLLKDLVLSPHYRPLSRQRAMLTVNSPPHGYIALCFKLEPCVCFLACVSNWL